MQTHCSVRLYIKHCNSGSPPGKPLCGCILFGKEDYFIDNERKTRGPPNGFCIVVLDGDDKSEEESDDESTQGLSPNQGTTRNSK